MSVKELEAEIMQLATKDQAYLLERLVQVLEDEEAPLTMEELDRRAEDLRSGRVNGVSPDKMLASAKRLL